MSTFPGGLLGNTFQCSEMVRSPCCEKMGLKRGPWTTEEDQVLISHINKYGHTNWRALPKQAGLLRCGKSCRLRWTNYLRPDIKRGNFIREEEDTIIRLHSMLGNRWSAIAARLPGRTDNEIKNVWHTHLKKRLKQSNFNSETKKSDSNLIREIKSEMIACHGGSDFCFESTSPQPSSSVTDASVISWETHSSFTSPQPSSSAKDASVISWETHSSFDAQQTGNAKLIPSIDQSFSIKSSSRVENSYHTFGLAEELSSTAADSIESDYHKSPPILDDCMDFWFDLLLRADDLPDLPEF